MENFSGTRREPAPTSYSTAPPSYTGYTGGQGVANQRYSALETTDNQVQEENQNQNTSSAPNVDEIRKRLAKIKAQAF